jgi:protein tyrosine phosphatase (PTP) superfamily phosphohydrolase (DUF442 family)
VGLDRIKNFAAINERLSTAGQPTEAQLEEVAKAGFDVVVNLGLVGQPYSLPDEAGLVASLGLAYHHIPVQFDAPTVEDLQRFFEIMDACAGEGGGAGKRVFVHCAANYRVASFVAMYGQARLGWSEAEAEACAGRFWALNGVWRGFVELVRGKIGSGG